MFHQQALDVALEFTHASAQHIEILASVTYLDAVGHGRRIVTTFRTKRLALAALKKLTQKKLTQKKRRPLHSTIDPLVTVADYVPRFLADCTAAEAAPRTLEAYAGVLSNHIVPRIGRLKVADVSRADVRGLLLTLGREAVSLQGQKGDAREGRKGLSRNSIRQHRALLSAFFDSAIRDELRDDNPAHNVFRKTKTKAARLKARPRVGETVKAMTAAERDRFLTAAQTAAPEWFTAWTLMALAGLRRNEALGLRWESLRLAARQIVVREQLHAGSTKSGDARAVDLAEPLAGHLRELRARLREEAFRRGESFDERERVCCPGLPDQPTRRQVETTIARPTRAMRRVVKRAGLSTHVTMHSLRHSLLAPHLVGREPGLRPAAGRACGRVLHGEGLRELVPGRRARSDGPPRRGRSVPAASESGNKWGHSGNIGLRTVAGNP